LEGRFAIVAISTESNTLIGARRGSPLILGLNAGEYFLASDIPAFLEHTQEVNYIDDDEMVVIDEDGAQFYALDSREPIEKRIISIDWEIEEAEKGDFPHFMIKEIMDQKETLTRAINTKAEDLNEVAEVIKRADHVYLVGCGTAGYVAQMGEYMFADGWIESWHSTTLRSQYPKPAR